MTTRRSVLQALAVAPVVCALPANLSRSILYWPDGGLTPDSTGYRMSVMEHVNIRPGDTVEVVREAFQRSFQSLGRDPVLAQHTLEVYQGFYKEPVFPPQVISAEQVLVDGDYASLLDMTRDRPSHVILYVYVDKDVVRRRYPACDVGAC